MDCASQESAEGEEQDGSATWSFSLVDTHNQVSVR